MTKTCTHLDTIRDVTPSAKGCEECLKTGSPWVHLRICRTCGHVGCCDDSPNRHATKHFRTTAHPIIEGYDPPAFSAARRPLGQQAGHDHEVVGEHRGANEQREALCALGAATLHAATAHQHRDAPFDAGAKALALLERRRLFVSLALRRFASAALRNADRVDAVIHA